MMWLRIHCVLCITHNCIRNNTRITILILFVFLFAGPVLSFSAEQSLTDHLKHFTMILSGRNLDSLRMEIDPHRIFVEISGRTGSYIAPSQTLAVLETFFRIRTPISFSYIVVKEESGVGMALGTLNVQENGKLRSYKVTFGFRKSTRNRWLLEKINIR